MRTHFPPTVVARAGLAVVALTLMAPAPAMAKPEPDAKRGFRLFARPLGALTINRVYCGLVSTGQICADSTNSSTIGGGFWPKGTADQYEFQTGVQIAGVIGPDGGPWAGDTTGSFFVDTKGTTEHGREVRPIYNASNPSDAAAWPAEALVPMGDESEEIYDEILRGRVSASQGDIWFVTWDGDPALNAGRPHPLGVMVETRGLGWNFPAGNEDIVYFVHTFYNVTSADPASYAAIRPAMRDVALQQGQQFQALNNAAFGITLPTGGYTIAEAYPAVITDMDVAQANINYASVNLPFALGTTYDRSFSRTDGWTFDPAIFSAPFFAGSGFVGIKYLKSPNGPGAIQLYSNTIRQGAFPDAQNTTQLYRYLSGNLSLAAGDAPCNQGDPAVSHICFVNNTAPADMRFFQSSTQLTLPPGEFVTVVVAHVFAAPVATPLCAPPCDIVPGNPRILGDPVAMAAGVNAHDVLTGYLGFEDTNGDGSVSQDEFVVVPRSLLGKALVAQAVFESQFLLPFAPDTPDFFLVPGNNQVSVIWRPSLSETTGDPYFAIGANAETGGNPNPLYDPNYRQFDVEGYRVYRGRIDAPNALTLIAQFDYSDSFMDDFGGQINPDPLCAPETGLTTNCPVAYDPADFLPGEERTVFNRVDLSGPITQVKFSDRTILADATAFVLKADTALTGVGGSCAPSACPELSDTGVPFVFIDDAVRNNFRYFYAVTAFDVNSWNSGPTNLESARVTKSVTPVAPASNYDNSAVVTTGIYGRDVLLDHTAPIPTLDPTTGRFSGPFPASNAWTIGLAGFVSQVISGQGGLTARLDSIRLGSPYSGTPVAHEYWVTASAGGAPAVVMLPITQPAEIGETSASATLPQVVIDGSLASRYGGQGTYSIPGSMSIKMEGPDYHSLYGRGCINGRFGFTTGGGCAYNGSRWFDGPSPATNETMVDPNAGSGANGGTVALTDFNNAGALTGVTLIHNVQAYNSAGGAGYRPLEGIKSGARRAADFNVYWGAGGLIDSVIDVTHNVPVPFAADHLGGTWGVLNPAETATNFAAAYDQRPELTAYDFNCIPPIKGFGGGGGTSACGAAGPTYTLSQTALPGPIVVAGCCEAAVRVATTPTPYPDAGFGLYLAGDIFTIGLEGGQVPAQGTVWALRTYIGAITGGHGAAGDLGDYAFTDNAAANRKVPRSWTAVGTEIRVSFDVAQQVNPATENDLSRVHPVPDPYYVTNEFETTTDNKVIKFVNLPQQAIIRIYSASGVLVALLEHSSTQFGGDETWNVRNRNNQVVASGVYFYHIEASDARRVGRMTIVNFAQ